MVNLPSIGEGSPIKNLCPEELRMIFDFCCQPTENRGMIYIEDRDWGVSYMCPLVLACVCRHWRQITHGQSSLWARLCVDETVTIDVVERYLARSGQQNLFIEFWGTFAMLQPVLKRRDRWYAMDMVFEDEEGLATIRGHFPRLKVLEVHPIYNSDNVVAIELDAPTLNTVRLRNTSNLQSITPSTLQSITNLSIVGLPLPNLILTSKNLSQCLSLTHLAIDGGGWGSSRETQSAEVDMVLLPNLRTISLRNVAKCLGLARLDLPALQEVRLGYSDYDSFFVTQPYMVAFLEGVSSSLTSLVIHDDVENETWAAGLSQVLALLPNLKVLSITEEGIQRSVVSALKTLHIDTALPMLEKLHIDTCWMSRPGLLLSVLEARRNISQTSRTPKLKILRGRFARLDIDKAKESSWNSRWRSLRRAGLLLSVTDYLQRLVEDAETFHQCKTKLAQSRYSSDDENMTGSDI